MIPFLLFLILLAILGLFWHAVWAAIVLIRVGIMLIVAAVLVYVILTTPASVTLTLTGLFMGIAALAALLLGITNYAKGRRSYWFG